MYLESTGYAQVTKVEGLGCQLGRVDPHPCTVYPPGVSITLFLRTTLLGAGNGRRRKNLGDFKEEGEGSYMYIYIFLGTQSIEFMRISRLEPLFILNKYYEIKIFNIFEIN